MFKLPSLQREYYLCSSMDPALDLPDIPVLPDDATPEAVSARDEAKKVRDHELKVARETGRWDQIVKSGEQPTRFKFRQIHGTPLSWLQGEIERRKLAHDEVCELAFRLAILDVENLGAVKIEFERIDNMPIAKAKSLDPIYDLGRDTNEPLLGRIVIIELGTYVYMRAIQGVPPLL